MDTEEPITIYPVERIVALALIGGVIVFVLFSQIWQDNGLITGVFSFPRVLTVLAAIALGGAIGWMTFPRIPLLGSKSDSETT